MRQPQPHRNRYKKAELAYTYLLNAEQTKQQFTLEDLARASNYEVGTIRGYISKKWRFMVKTENGSYIVKGLSNYPFYLFKKDLSQKAKQHPRQNLPVIHTTKLTQLSKRQVVMIVGLSLVWSITLLLLRKRRWWFIPL